MLVLISHIWCRSFHFQLRGRDRLDPQLQKLFGQGNRKTDLDEETEPKRLKSGKVKLGRKPADALSEPSENGYKPEGAAGGGKGGGKKRKSGKRAGGKGLNAPGDNAAEGDEEESRRFLQAAADEFPDEADKSPEAEELRKKIRAKKHEEIHARYKERRQKEILERETRNDEPDRLSPHDPPSRSNRHSESMEERMAQRHKEMRDRHTRDRDRTSGRDRSSHTSSGRRERHRRPENEGRHAVLRRRINKHEHLFTPEELAEIHEDLNGHKVEEDRLDKARDKLNAEFDALRDIDDRDERLEQLEVLKQKRADTRDGDRTARDSLRERFQVIRDKLEAKLKTDL